MSTPTSTEDRLRHSLERAASAVEVDASALYAATRARLDEAPPAPPRRGWVPVVVAAAAVVLVVGAGLVALDRVVDGARDLTVTGEVDDEFTCPVQSTTTFGPRNDDDSFLPELSNSLQPRGEAAVTKNWEVDPTEGGAVLRLGNRDGTLASITTFEKRGDAYEPVSVTKCTNEAPSGGPSTDLVMPGLPPIRNGETPTSGVFPEGPVKVLDRLTYDTAGLQTRQTMWAQPCADRLCLVTGTPRTTRMSQDLDGTSRVPYDVSDQLADPDDVVGQDLGLTLIALYDRPNEVYGVTANAPDGRTTDAEVIRSDGWPGRLFLLLVPTDDLASVSVLPVGGGRERELTLDQLHD